MQSGQGETPMGTLFNIYCRVFFHLESFFVNISDVLHNMFREIAVWMTVCRPMFVGLAES